MVNKTKDAVETKAKKNVPLRHRKKDTEEPKPSTSSATPVVEGPDHYYGLTWRKILARILLSVGIMGVLYLHSKEAEPYKCMATQEEIIQERTVEVKCDPDYKEEIKQFKGCLPERCGRMVSDILVTPEEAKTLLRIAKKGLSLGKPDGGVTVLDLYSGALTQGKHFINAYKVSKEPVTYDLFNKEEYKVYRSVREKIQHMIAFRFGLLPTALQLTNPTFFSRMTNRPPRTIHDEYWHVHVDKVTYPQFHYTSVIYLSDYGIDFTGGRFIYTDPKLNLTVEPKMGRVNAFTSGLENPHFVERVETGARIALTIAFTCNKTLAIHVPNLTGTMLVKDPV